MDGRINKIVGRFKHKQAVDTDAVIGLNLETTSRLIKTNANPINSIIGQDEQFELEREESNLYRFLGRLQIITSNELTRGGTLGTTTIQGALDEDWDPLFDGNPALTPNNWLLQLCYPSDKDESYEMWGTNKPVSLGMKIVSVGSSNPSANRSLLTITTKQKHKLTAGDYIHINDIGGSNDIEGYHKVFEVGINGDDMEYSFTLETTYSSSYIVVEGFIKRCYNISGDDIIGFNNKQFVQIISCDMTGGTTNGDYVTLTSTLNHYLSVGDYIQITGIQNQNMKGLHRVIHVIDNFRYVIKYKISNVPNQNFTTNMFYRRVEGTPSDYYVRMFEVLTTNEYDIHPAAFGKGPYPNTVDKTLGINNGTWLFHLTKDINTTGLLSHRNGIVNEIHLCVLKRAGKNTFDWTNVTSHWDFNYETANTLNGLEIVSVRQGVSVGSIVKNSRGSKYIGDICEYNRKEIKEKTITEVVFRFGITTGGYISTDVVTTIPAVTIPIPGGGNLTIIPQREVIETILTPSNSDGEGYFYKPFKKLEIKKFSTNLEVAESTDSIDGIPMDYEEYPDGTIAWRDLLPNGIIQLGNNGVDWPFMNGRHYVYLNHNVYVRRQKPNQLYTNDDLLVNPKNIC